VLVDLIGYLGVALTVATYAVTTMIPLRILGVAAGCVLLVYAIHTNDIPQLVMELILIPLNGYRLFEMVRLTHRVKAAADSDLSMDWLRPFSRRQKCDAGTTLFRLGDTADSMYYIESGRYRLLEAGIELKPGELVGELGLLSPGNVRTQTLQCVEAGELLRITYLDFKQLYYQNPKFGFYFLRIVSERLFHNVDAAKAAMQPAPANG
jgi:CRP/FNR family transcriptional regulator, cyclic AMP receptor protein